MKKRMVGFNEKTALEIFTILDKYYREKIGIFKDATLPQDNYPSEKSLPLTKQETLDWFFFLAIPMRGGIVSDAATKKLWELRKKYPTLFNPQEVVIKWSVKKILGLFIEEGFNYKNKDHAKNWYRNSENLIRYWGGDIRNVFHEVSDFEEAFKRIDHEKSKMGFYGMRRKIFSLLTIWLQEKGLVPIFPTPIPVDFHALRILWATEVINPQDWIKPFIPNPDQPVQLTGKISIRISEGLINQVAMWSQEFLQKINISHLIINPAIWIIGINLCKRNFQLRSRENGMLYTESEDLEKNPKLWPISYKNPCGVCPIEKYCKWAISSSPYFDFGCLIKLGKRVSHPQLPLSIPELQTLPHKNRGASRA